MRTLRPYQLKAFNEIFETWKEHDVVMYCLATGGGKTVLFVEIIRKLLQQQKRSMLVAHRQELIYQAARTLYVQEIDSGIIMASIPTQLDKPVQVCSVQTICRRATLPPADYYIFDEGHHAQRDNTWGKLIKQAIASGAKILLVTATPYRLSGEGFEYLHDYKPTKLILGPQLKELQDDGWLVEIKYFAASIPDLTNIHLQSGEYKEDEAEEAMRLAPIVESYIGHVNHLQGICFCVNVAHANKVCNEYNEAGIPAAVVSATTPDEERKAIIEAFREKRVMVVINVGIFTEGADFPMCQFVQLATPTKSLSKFLQMIGRVTRPCIEIDKYNSKEMRKHYIKQSNKPCGYVLDNAGCWLDHNLPEIEHDWESYFIGMKKLKKKQEEVFEMLIFIAEALDGTRIKTSSPQEVEGLRLVEITTEQRKKYINLACLKDFDRTYFTFMNMRQMNKPGYLAIEDFIKQCAKNNVLMVDEVWEHLWIRCVTEPDEKAAELQVTRSKNMEVYSDEIYLNALKKIQKGRVSREWLSKKRQEYEKGNIGQIRQHRKTA